MPEGIEIASISMDLNKKLHGKLLLDFQVNQHYLNRVGGEYKDFMKMLPLEIKHVTFKGKVIVFNLGDVCFTSQLGMSGRWGSKDDVPHVHLNLKFGNSERSKGFWMHYSDVRRFGNVRFYCGEKGKNDLKEKLDKLAPDFLSPNPISKVQFLERIDKCPQPSYLATLLMDQEKICSGVGNYILSELFYRCKLHPFTRIFDLSGKDKRNLYAELKKIMWDGLNSKGNSIQDYYNVDGSKGKYQEQLRVYMKKQDPLGNRVIRQDGPHKRTIHWVPEIQKRKLRVLIKGDSENFEFGWSILTRPYKNCELKIIRNTYSEKLSGLSHEKTEDDRPHLILKLDSDGNEGRNNSMVERIVSIE